MKRTFTAAVYLNTINIIYWAQAASLFIFGMVVLYLSQSLQPANEDLASTLQYVLIAFFIMGLAASRIIPPYLLKKIDPALELKYKMPRYVQCLIIRSACLEMPGLFACVVAFVTGQVYYLGIVPLLFILFLLYRPTKSTIAEDLNLSQEERNQLDDPNAIIAETNRR